MCPNDEKLHTKKINYHYFVTLFSLFCRHISSLESIGTLFFPFRVVGSS